MSPGWVAFLIVCSLILSGLVQLWRGMTQVTRTYDGTDALAVLIEIPLLIWGVLYLLEN